MSLIERALRNVNDPVVSVSPAPRQASPPEPAGAPPQAAKPWLPRAPSQAPPAWPSLVLVGVAVLALTIVLVIGGSFWLGRTLGATRAAPAAARMPEAEPAAATSAAAWPAPALLTAEPATVPPAAPMAAGEPSPARSLISVSDTPLLALPWGVLPKRPAEERLRLTGVVEGMGESYAVINGTIVGLGERVDGFTLTKIANGSVTVRDHNGEEAVLRVAR